MTVSHLPEPAAAAIEGAIAARIFPGCVLLVAAPGQPSLHVACGSTMYDDAGSRPVAPGDIYDVASLTKVFTATAALVLHDRGQVALDREARHYLPALRARGVTVRHLLTHSSGLDLRLSAGFNPPAALAPRIPPTEWDEAWRGGLVHGGVHDESAAALGGVAGHAGLFSTAADLERLLRLWLQGGAWGGRQLLREAGVAAALRDHTAGLPTLSGVPVRSGLGWMLDRANFMGAAPAGSFGHTGFTGPAMVGVPARGLAFVLLSNRTYPRRTPPPYRHHAVTADVLETVLTQ